MTVIWKDRNIMTSNSGRSRISDKVWNHFPNILSIRQHEKCWTIWLGQPWVSCINSKLRWALEALKQGDWKIVDRKTPKVSFSFFLLWPRPIQGSSPHAVASASSGYRTYGFSSHLETPQCNRHRQGEGSLFSVEPRLPFRLFLEEALIYFFFYWLCLALFGQSMKGGGGGGR